MVGFAGGVLPSAKASMLPRPSGSEVEKRGKTMEKQHFLELMSTLDCLEATAADLMDTVTTARAELKQTFEKIEQTAQGRASA